MNDIILMAVNTLGVVLALGVIVLLIVAVLFCYARVLLYFGKRAFNITENLKLVARWHRNGQPDFQQVNADGTRAIDMPFRMWPTAPGNWREVSK